MGFSYRSPSSIEITCSASKSAPQAAPVIPKKPDRIVMQSHIKATSLMYLDNGYFYLNEQILKKLKQLRGGDISSNLTLAAITVVVILMCHLAGVDSFLPILRRANAPHVQPGVGPQTPAPSTQRSEVPTWAREFNDLSLRFNERCPKYDFKMSEEEAHQKLNEKYTGGMDLDENTHVSDWKAAAKMYHGSQIGVSPEDYGMTAIDLEGLNEIGLVKYTREGRPLPPIELVQDFQKAVKRICDNGQLKEGTYSSRAEQKVHKAIYKYNPKTREIAGFYKETGELITVTKYKQSAFDKFRATWNN